MNATSRSSRVIVFQYDELTERIDRSWNDLARRNSKISERHDFPCSLPSGRPILFSSGGTRKALRYSLAVGTASRLSSGPCTRTTLVKDG